ncbi:hypothetical protein PC9H_003402 [Pleurotus ostreatus]|uniref:BRCT domain-containing protein n=2 Tax=Pleurotus TaxID=5320 RepID=A0A8H7A0U1_PLEOS|nr:uncharacterized protein PC9H_003402 [Pleurotus ostreatus]KAF7436569.1 hypothetical protein PC9H_003402 [Pleurotus ostreatus]KAG9222573.1 hypothetical protein CCMSSC00406_0002908 [Pleurotus cornucopiae]
MDAYFAVKKPSALRASSEKKSDTNKNKKPYARQSGRDETNITKPNKVGELSTRELNKLVLSTLSHESNPVTHSDIYERTEHIVSAATGHQRGDGRANGPQKTYFEHRTKKLSEQKVAAAGNASSEPQVMRNVRIYINGYLSNTTDIEMKRVVVRAGGDVLLTPSGATHILTSQQLSGSKTHKLTAKSRNHVHVVKPEWVTDSIKTGKKLKEMDYAVIKSTNAQSLTSMLRKQ